MSRDGLLPAWFSHAHPRFHTPHRPTLVIGALTAIVAGLYPIREVAELVNIGTLSAFVVICISIIVMRRTRPDAQRSFRTPLVPFVPLVGVGFSLWLLSKLPPAAWERFVIWMTIGLIFYFSYGRERSKLARAARASAE
ncbi:amino acid permease [Methylosinus sp. RM1]|uniref:amino acid permease n=1 Tax=Methylosinus sp. RM1 TaxID=2583817 RepID=UPI00210327FF|nr:amino acid permease [Methylosinus sp. RM1]